MGYQPQNGDTAVTIRQGLPMQLVPAFDQLGELPTLLWLDASARVFCALPARGGLEMLRLRLGLDALAETLALDRLHIDEPATVGVALVAHFVMVI